MDTGNQPYTESAALHACFCAAVFIADGCGVQYRVRLAVFAGNIPVIFPI